jgi:hypothetical protein
MTDGSLIKANAALKSLEERMPANPESAPPINEALKIPTEEAPTPVEPVLDQTNIDEEVEVKNDVPGESEKGKKSKSILGKTFSNKTHVSRTDPDATLAGKAEDKKLLRYNVHQSIDPDHRIIIDCHVTTGAVPDGTVYQERLLSIENTFGYKIEEVTADRGYGYGENLQFLKDRGIRSFVPRFHKDVGEKTDREKTPYDVVTDEFRCEEGNRLPRFGIHKDGTVVHRPVVGSCGTCEKTPWCLIKRRGIRVNPYHQVHHETRLMEQTDEFKAKRKERMWKVEGLFAEGKTCHGLSRARYRRRWKVQVQIYLTASVQNLKRLLGVALSDFISTLVVRVQFAFYRKFAHKISFFRAAFA